MCLAKTAQHAMPPNNPSTIIKQPILYYCQTALNLLLPKQPTCTSSKEVHQALLPQQPIMYYSQNNQACSIASAACSAVISAQLPQQSNIYYCQKGQHALLPKAEKHAILPKTGQHAPSPWPSDIKQRQSKIVLRNGIFF
jgi:hypothetical protein